MRDSLEVTERYTITNIWKTSVDQKELSCSFDARTISEVVQVPKRDSRKMPLRNVHPVRREHHTRIFLKEDWDIRPETVTVTNKAFRFRFNSRAEMRR